MDWVPRIFESRPAEEYFIEWEGTDYPASATLRAWLQRFGGVEGELRDPSDPNRYHAISLAEWTDRDPDSTWLSVVFEREGR
jgi:hypothetical protein